jgi:hypothetical protein
MRARQFLGSVLAVYAVLMVALGINYAALWRPESCLALMRSSRNSIATAPSTT